MRTRRSSECGLCNGIGCPDCNDKPQDRAPCICGFGVRMDCKSDHDTTGCTCGESGGRPLLHKRGCQVREALR